ncbi:hypothetical protein [Streptomyces sp. NPDC049879]|uniref:hypothetical protein n=1 Tax=Streptomyces sp. NPDC049879 TaxID=3365598 RepID=UPI003792E2CE
MVTEDERPAPDAQPPGPAEEPSAAAVDEGGRPADAWDAARELRDYAPSAFGAAARHGVSGGRVTGDVVLGDKVYVGGPREQLHLSGEVPGAEVAALAEVFHEGDAFEGALAELRASRVVILRGDHDSGRRAAALMLLRRAGASRIRALDPDTGPAALVKDVAAADGYVVCDLVTTRSNPLRQHHLLRCQERMRKRDAYLVVTVARSAALGDVEPVEWRRPGPESVLAAHLRHHLASDGEAGRLLALPQVRAFLSVGGRPARHVAGFAAEVLRHHRGEIPAEELESYGQEALLREVDGWLSAPPDRVGLRDKAFLLALAVLDEGPYATVAQLGDRLCGELQAVESPGDEPGLTVFGTSRAARMELARADVYVESALTSWGPEDREMTRFRDRGTADLLLREAWSAHPAVRGPFAAWLTELARDGDPFVRTRAAASAAALARHDFSAAMHGLVHGWASSRDYRLSVQAANALALAAYAGTAAVHRVLRDWAAGGHPRRRWTAVRVYALTGPLAPEETLDALAELARTASRADGTDSAGGEDGAGGDGEAAALVQATELLLLSTPGDSVPRRLVRWCVDDSPALRALAHGALVSAAVRREEPHDDPAGWPVLLRRWDEEDAGSPVREALAALWRRVLRDRAAGGAAQRCLRAWVLVAGRDEAAEAALAGMLPALVTAGSDADRLGYLLRTMPDENGGPPPPVAARLLAALRRGT